MRWAARWASRRCSSSGREGTFELRRGFRLEPGTQGADGRGRGHHRPVVARGDRGGRGGRRRGHRRSGAGRPLGRQGRPRRAVHPADPDRRPDLRGRRSCRRSWRRSRRSSPGAARPRDAAGSASASISTMSRPSGTRAAATIPTRCAPRIVAAEAGADGITAHLREDRRHITDDDIDRLMAEIDLPLNLEMAATEEMLGDRACATARTPPASSPKSARSAPPKAGSTPPASTITSLIMSTSSAPPDIRVSLFIEPTERAGRGRDPPRRAGRRVPHRPLRPCRGRGARRPS